MRPLQLNTDQQPVWTLQNTDIIGGCYNISENTLDGIFSAEEMFRLKKEAKEEGRRRKKACLNSFNQSYIIEIAPKLATKRGKEETIAKFEEYPGQARLRKCSIFLMNAASSPSCSCPS